MKKTKLKLKKVTLGTLSTRDLLEARGGVYADGGGGGGASATCYASDGGGGGGGGGSSCDVYLSNCYTTQTKCVDSAGST